MTPRLSELADILAAVLDAIPSPILVVDGDVQIIGYNLAAAQLLGQNPELVLRRRAGEILHCLHSTEAPEGCGHAPACPDCPVRNSVNESIRGQRVVRKKARLQLVTEGQPLDLYLLVTTAPFAHQDKSLVLLILEDIGELMELKSILPICFGCKKIRNDQEYWQSVEKYFSDHLDLEFTHGLCPECAKRLYEEYLED